MQEVIVYRYKGLGGPLPPDVQDDELPPDAKKFDAFFTRLYATVLVSNAAEPAQVRPCRDQSVPAAAPVLGSHSHGGDSPGQWCCHQQHKEVPLSKAVVSLAHTRLPHPTPPLGRLVSACLCAHAALPPSRVQTLCKDFLLLAEGGELLICATSSQPDAHPAAARGALPGVPAMEVITLHLVRLADGAVVDRRVFCNDFIHLGHNAGVFLYDDLLAVLSVRFQCVHILQVSRAAPSPGLISESCVSVHSPLCSFRDTAV